MSGRFIGMDIGGTSTRITYTTSLEIPLLENKIIFPTTKNFEADLSKITEYIDANLPIQGVGIGLPGTLNDEKSSIVSTNHTQGYINKPLTNILSKKYHCIVRMENDAEVAALGEALYGTKEKKTFLYIIWGTGVGGCLVDYKHGKPISNKLDRSVYLESWEETFGGKSLEMRYGKPPEQFTNQEWNDVMEGFAKVIMNSAAKLHAQKLIFGGGIAVKQARWIKQSMAQLYDRFPTQLPEITISSLGEEAGLYGALGLLK